jgi:uncharacterized protein YfiM (DUF2279 family)
MRLKSILVAVLVSIFVTPAQALDTDKKLHFGVSAFLSASMYASARASGYKKNEAKVAAFIGTVAIGLVKEVSDPVFDREDLVFDILGAAVPLVIIDF